MSDSKKDIERKKKEVMQKLKNGEFITTAERPLASHGSFWVVPCRAGQGRLKVMNLSFRAG